MSLSHYADELDMSEKRCSEVSCPYCQSVFKDNEELSKHIDRIHSGSGLLEGDVRKW
jgi:Zn-finger nucleic acid-binding protein